MSSIVRVASHLRRTVARPPSSPSSSASSASQAFPDVIRPLPAEPADFLPDAPALHSALNLHGMHGAQCTGHGTTLRAGLMSRMWRRGGGRGRLDADAAVRARDAVAVPYAAAASGHAAFAAERPTRLLTAHRTAACPLSRVRNALPQSP